MEKNVGQRLLVIGVVVAIAFILLWPPQQKLRPGLDIAGGTSLIFEISTAGAESDPGLAERVKTLLQRRVDPAGVYNLTWRVHGRNRIEVQMPLPPREATARRRAFAEALDTLYAQELRRGALEAALRAERDARAAELQRLARGRADVVLAAQVADVAEIERVVADRQALLEECAARYDALMAAEEDLRRGPQPVAEPGADAAAEPELDAAAEPATAPTTEPESEATTEPATQAVTQPAEPPVTLESLRAAQRDAMELFEDAVQDVLSTNLSRRRFEEILDLDTKSPLRKRSLEQLIGRHADLRDLLDDVLAKHTAWHSGKQFLDSPADLKRLLRGAGKLEFRILAEADPGNPTRYDRYREQLKEGRLRLAEQEFGWFQIDNPMQFFNLESPADLEAYKPESDSRYVVDRIEDRYFVLGKLSPEHGLLQDVKGQRKWRLNRARPDMDEHGRPSVAFELDVVGGQMFENLTRRNIDRPLCILVDDIAYTAPNIQSVIRTHGQITGDFSRDKIVYLVQTMEGGMLPARLKDTPLSERTIGSSLGETNRDYAVRAGLIGAVAVIVVMLGYYWACGAIANVALFLNVGFTLAALAMLGARITLDGIAGLILAVGMSVDANVLIYERMREEKERGGSLRMIIKNGYDKAFSTIFDSNVTTLLTCVIIYYAGSEEVKGFGLTLGWGIALNLFSAVFVTRTLFSVLLKYNLIKDVNMLKIISVPRIDWYSKAKYLIPVSCVVVITGWSLLYFRGTRNLFDIEFLGGVAAELELQRAGLDDRTISARLQKTSTTIAERARQLQEASVEPVAGDASAFVVRLPGVPAAELEAFLTEPLEAENLLQRGGVNAQPGEEQITVRLQSELTLEQFRDKVRDVASALGEDANNLGLANVNAVLEVGGVAQRGLVWNVTTTVTNMRLVKHALTLALGDEMRIQPSIAYHFRGVGERPFPVTGRLLDTVVPGLPPGVNADVTDYLGGAAICLEQLDPPQAIDALRERLENTHFQPDFQDWPKRDFTVIGVRRAGEEADEEGRPLYADIVVVTRDPDFPYAADPESWYTGFAQQEMQLVQAALTSEQSLRKVMQFKPQIATRATQQAILAVLLSSLMIIAYVWIRFGRVSYGLGGVFALLHDVLIAFAFVGFSGWLADTALGRGLLIENFKINMPIVAALLTIIGFSINDTIVIFDRIREIRGRLGIVTPKIINDAVNECMSRTILTTFTLLVVIFIAYIWGGSSIRGFNYCMLIGCLSGTYSTIVIAGPLVYKFARGPRAAAVPAA